MTAVVGVQGPRGVWLGVDSLGSDDWCQQNRLDSKLFRRGPFLIGFTDSFRMGQLLRYSLDVPAIAPGMDLHEFMATTFIDSVRRCLKDGGFATKDKEQEEGGAFLVAVAGRLFDVAGDYQVGENAEGYAVAGSGYATALGSLETSGRLGVGAHQRCLLALEAAARHSRGVRGPFSLKYDPAVALSLVDGVSA